MFVDFFIHRPVFATVCALLIILAGAVCIPTLPIELYPDLAPPQVAVTSTYIGANADTVEKAVTIPLEEAINGVEGMRYISSSSTNSGVSQINIFFHTGYNLDIASVDVQNRVASVQGRLPAAVNATGITIVKVSTNFVFGSGFFTRDNRYSNEFISNYLDVYVKDALKRVPGVGDVQIFGERKYAMRMWLDPLKLASRGLTATDVVNALLEQNIEIPAGQLGQPPSDSKQAFETPVRVVGRLTDPAQFDNIILKNSPNGLVLFKDVGHSEVGAEDYSTTLKYSGFPAVGIGVQQLSNANALDVDRNAKAVLEQLKPSFPPGLEYAIAFDSTTIVGDSIREVLITLGEAIAIVIVVIFLFLLDWRATIIPAVTIPVSLIGTFAFIKVFGFSINSLTLFGITLATGLVVDDAIVVIENVQRHIAAEHCDPHKAASEAMGEVTSAVIATSLVLIAVFVPVSFFPGTTGILYRQFSLTIAFCHRHLRLQRAYAFAGALGHVPARRRRTAAAVGLSAHRLRVQSHCSIYPRDRRCDRMDGKHLRQGYPFRAAAALPGAGDIHCRPRGNCMGIPTRTDSLHSPGRSGLPHRHRSSASWRVAGLHRGHCRPGAGSDLHQQGRSRLFRRDGIQFFRSLAQRRPYLSCHQTLRSAPREGALRVGHRCRSLSKTHHDSRRSGLHR